MSKKEIIGNRFGVLDYIVNFCAVLAATMVCALVLIIVGDIVSRNLRIFSMPWSLDVAEYSLYLITFLGAPWVLREEGHIAVDILVERLSPANRVRMERVAQIVAGLVCLILFVVSAGVCWRSYSTGTLIHETFVFPEWWMLIVAPPIFLILMIMFIRMIFWPEQAHDQQSVGF
ncbi:MAG: TRAP transporter small permease [Rhodospirillaceae bacterium]|jgi:TRAP-type C4-dicarboxylate transport system permease small subunit|nr:TRAP transporter small permease [Rhodospirillaceae bacterium]MBT5939418.1 TRAP transporter small permease [Rhodospirillaceae bacterium]MBT7266649.1 TRAP transporter small permease [Rhodospirillaceae bacterium]